MKVHGVADGGEIAPAIVEDLAAVDRNALEEVENMNMGDGMDDDEDEEEDNMCSQTPIPEDGIGLINRVWKLWTCTSLVTNMVAA